MGKKSRNKGKQENKKNRKGRNAASDHAAVEGRQRQGSSSDAAGGAHHARKGTRDTPYRATRIIDADYEAERLAPTTKVDFQSITAMRQYETKSFEELRLEDYMASAVAENENERLDDDMAGTGNKGSNGVTDFPKKLIYELLCKDSLHPMTITQIHQVRRACLFVHHHHSCAHCIIH